MKRAYLLLFLSILIYEQDLRACETDTPANRFLSNRSVGMVLQMSNILRFQFTEDVFIGLCLPISENKEIQLLGSYGSSIGTSLIPRSWNNREFGMQIGYYSYFSPDEMTSPFVGISFTSRFYHIYDEFFGGTERFITIKNFSASISGCAGISYAPTEYMQLTYGYHVTYTRDVNYDTVANGVRQSVLLTVKFKPF